MTVRLAVWSGPRNISTALMRSWENRTDTVVLDEPFYAAYLARTGLDHPGREEVLASQPTDPVAVVDDLLAPLDVAVQYSKQMTHHLDLDADLGWLDQLRHVLLIRDPAEVVASYVRSREACEPEDIGLLQQLCLADVLPARHPGDRRRRLPARPRGSPALAVRLARDRLHRRDADLAGRAPRADGVWAPHWYDAVLASTGFAAYTPREVSLDPHDAAVAEACRPAYDELRARRLRP